MIFRGNMLTTVRDAFTLCGMVASQPEQLVEGALSEGWGRGRIKFPVCSKTCYFISSILTTAWIGQIEPHSTHKPASILKLIATPLLVRPEMQNCWAGLWNQMSRRKPGFCKLEEFISGIYQCFKWLESWQRGGEIQVPFLQPALPLIQTT